MRSLFAFATLFIGLVTVEGFVPLQEAFQQFRHGRVTPHSVVALEAAGGKKKKRRRKRLPVAQSSEAAPREVVAPVPIEAVVAKDDDEVEVLVTALPSEEESQVDMTAISEVASFQFKPDDTITKGIQNKRSGSDDNDDDPLVLPDIKSMLKKKEIEQEKARIEEEKKESVKKIKRSDKEAFTKLLESQPYADADDSFFEQEEYGTVSALLGERAKSFVGIPPGPLQVGHFIGSLVIILMAYVEYPGFPLTNLPTPVRECFQGGLATIYFINLILAVIATFKATERGQSKVLWGLKTFSVGGLAYDQLTQLPTVEEVEAANARKGKRSLKNR